MRKNLMDGGVGEDGGVTTFFTVDTYFGHAKLLRTRPAFATIEGRLIKSMSYITETIRFERV